MEVEWQVGGYGRLSEKLLHRPLDYRRMLSWPDSRREAVLHPNFIGSTTRRSHSRFEAVDPDHLNNSNHSHFVCTECDRGDCLEALGMYGLIKTQSQSSAIGRKSKTLLKGECPAFFEQREPVTNAESSATQFVEPACFVGCS